LVCPSMIWTNIDLSSVEPPPIMRQAASEPQRARRPGDPRLDTC
jgi:hypothetical protein